MADFEGGRITSDGAGLVLKLNHRYRLTDKAARRLHDPRDSRQVKHDLLTLVRQRLFAFPQPASRPVTPLKSCETGALIPVMHNAGSKKPVCLDQFAELDVHNSKICLGTQVPDCILTCPGPGCRTSVGVLTIPEKCLSLLQMEHADMKPTTQEETP